MMSLLLNTIGTLMLIYGGTWGTEILLNRYATTEAGSAPAGGEEASTQVSPPAPLAVPETQ